MQNAFTELKKMFATATNTVEEADRKVSVDSMEQMASNAGIDEKFTSQLNPLLNEQEAKQYVSGKEGKKEIEEKKHDEEVLGRVLDSLLKDMF